MQRAHRRLAAQTALTLTQKFHSQTKRRDWRRCRESDEATVNVR